jgi:MFS family permease
MSHSASANPTPSLSGQTREARPTRVRYIVLGFLCVLAFLTYFDRVCITSAQADIQHDLRITDRQMGWIFGGFWLAYGLFEIPAGSIGDRFGARGTLSAIAAAWSLFTALSGAATGFATLLIYRVMFGVGEAGAYPNMARVQHAWFSPRVHARVGGFLWLVSRWGGAISYVAFPALLSALNATRFRDALHGLGLNALAHMPAWRMGFWVCGVAGVAWVVLFYPWFRDDPERKPSVNEAELKLIESGRAPGDRKHASFNADTWAMLLGSASLWGIAIAYLGTSFGWSFLVSWMNQFLLDTYKVSYGGSSLLKMLPLFVGGIACLIGGALSDLYVRYTGQKRFGRVIFPICGSLIAAVSMACIPFTHTPRHAMALVCLASFASDLGQAPAWAAIIGVGGEFAGTAFGFVNMIANAGGNFLAPVICPMIFHRFGWSTMMYVYALSFLIATSMWLLINPTRRFDEPATA